MSKELRDTHEEDWKTESFYEEVNGDLDAMRGMKPQSGVFETDEEFFQRKRAEKYNRQKR